MEMMIAHGAEQRSDNGLLRTMFEDRKAIFVDLLRWDLLVLDGRYEMDAFDDGQAIYLIIADERGIHLGSARLLPTTRHHLLGSLFADLCAAPPPTGPDVYEITRFCLSRRLRAEDRRIVRNQLVSGLAAYALDQGITTYTGVAELAWLQQILAFGWRCRPLGPPIRFDCGLLGALAIDITPDTPGQLAANGIWQPVGEPDLVREAA